MFCDLNKNYNLQDQAQKPLILHCGLNRKSPGFRWWLFTAVCFRPNAQQYPHSIFQKSIQVNIHKQ